MYKLTFFLTVLCYGMVCFGSNKQVDIPANGVYIFTESGEFIKASMWSNTSSPVGIALITNNTKALISLSEPCDDIEWGPSGFVNGIVATEYNYSNNIPGKANDDYSGFSNTQLAVDALNPKSNHAISIANNYHFTNNITGYLPALGELNDMMNHFTDIQDALLAIAAEPIKQAPYWSSTQHYLDYRAWAWSIGEGGAFAMLRNDNTPVSSWTNHCRVRPFAKIPQQIEIDREVDHDEYVDLGLPSGTLWATCNLGAESPESPGFYYQWGDDVIVSQDNCNEHRYYSGTTDISGTNYDTARKIKGKLWRMPTKKECEELYKYTVRKDSTINDKEVLTVKGPNGNQMIIPKIGYFNATGGNMKGTGFWTSTPLGSNLAYRQWEWTYISYSGKEMGFPVRAVFCPENIVMPVCATPTVSFVDGKLHFSCDTDDAKYHYRMQISEHFFGETTSDVILPNTYSLIVTVFAEAEGYEPSEEITQTFSFFVDDVNGDGDVNIGDITTLVNKILQTSISE